MIVVLLCATVAEAKKHAADAGLRPNSRDVVTPSGPAVLEGLRLTEADLIMEFPGFRQRKDAQDIIDELHRCTRAAGDAGPVWRVAGKTPTAA